MLDRSLPIENRLKAFELVDKFRAAHAYPLNTFQSTLHKKLKSFPNSFMAQRLKRMPTITRKLRNEPLMQVTTMQDIGGLRAVVSSIREVYRLERMYSLSRFTHIQKNAVDYISAPRDSGYRGLHLIYEYHNNANKDYDGLLLELQIRTRIQHSWATAVEIMELITKEPLKSSRGSEEWLRFFALTSSAFAYLEKTNLVPGYSDLTKNETFRLVKEAESRLNVRKVLESLPLIPSEIVTQHHASQYHLIIQDFTSEKPRVTVKSYGRASIEKAAKDYAEAEAEARRTESYVNIVLVSARELKKAYPNFFLESKDFTKNLTKVIDAAERETSIVA